MTPALVWILPLLPFTAFCVNGLFGRWLKEMGGWIAVGMMGFAAAIAAHAGWFAITGRADLPVKSGPIWEWITVAPLSISFGFHYDQLTAVMLGVVTFVGTLVFLYSIGYMHNDPGFNRFFAYLSLFATAMLILVLADSFPVLFIGWEGVGLCSYLLIGYYLEMPGAPDAGKKAFIVNRIGDAGFLLAMFLIYKHTGTLNIADSLAKAPEVFAYAGGAVTAVGLLLFLGCTGKSAQIPLFTWLPDAMAGPTPVSALIHAATMVTAGVYLVARTSPIFALAPVAMQTVACIGALTAFVAGSIALTQRDIKKVLAYSTVSQLGYMFLACGVGAFSAGIFHVTTHAFFKGCLFLGAGAVIHAVHGNQDLFLMGGLRKKIPVVWITYALATLAISGMPPFAGFFSKDEILWKTFSGGHPFLYMIAIVTALMTVFYSFRGLILAFHGECRVPEPSRSHIHAPHWTMTLALMILAFGSVFVGILNVPHILAPFFGQEHGAAFEHFLAPVIEPAEHILHAHASESWLPGAWIERLLMLFSVGLVCFGIHLARKYELKNWPAEADALASRFAFLNQLSAKRWWWDDAYRFVFAGGTRVIAEIAVLFDRFVIDGILHVTGKGTLEAGRLIRKVQSGQVQAYALGALIGANILILVVLIW